MHDRSPTARPSWSRAPRRGLMPVAALVAAGAVIALGSLVRAQPDLGTTRRVQPADADVIIWMDEQGVTQATGPSGLISADGSASAVFAAAFAALTPGRQWKEKVLVKGGPMPYQLTDTLFIPSWTILENRGTIQKMPNTAGTMVEISAGTNIDLRGGVYDGNEDNQPGGDAIFAHLFRFFAASDVVIDGVHAVNAAYDSFIVTGNSSDLHFVNCVVDNARDDGFNPLTCRGVTFTGCVARHVANDGFHLSVGATDVLVSNCVSHDNGESGVHVRAVRTVVSNTTSYANGSAGIWVHPDARNAHLGGCLVEGCVAGIVAGGTMTASVEKLTVEGCQVIGCETDGVYLSYAPGALVSGVVVDGNTGFGDGIRVSNSAGVTVRGCSVSGVSGFSINVGAASPDAILRDNRLDLADANLQGERTRVNGIGQAAAGPGGTPTALDWEIGDQVYNVDDQTLWVKTPAGDMIQIGG